MKIKTLKVKGITLIKIVGYLIILSIVILAMIKISLEVGNKISLLLKKIKLM